MKIQGIVTILFVSCTAIISCSAMTADGDERIQSGPTPTVTMPEKQQPATSNKNGFEQRFYGPTTIIKPNNNGEPLVGKPGPATIVQKPLPVNAATDLMLIEEFVKRGLVQRIRDGSLSLTGSPAFLELKSSLGAKPLICNDLPKQKGDQKKP